MRLDHRTRYRGALYGTMVAAVFSAAGCTSPWWNAFISPNEIGNFRENRVNEIQESISFRDKPLGVPGACDPTPEDLVATVTEYQIGPADAVSIRLLDFMQLGTETELQLIVDDLGYIDVPQIGWLRVEGMTARQIQSEIVRQAKNAEIYPADATPTVTVQILSRQHRSFNISGVINAPGEYPITRPDLRLREAINQAGSLADPVKVVYVFRNGERPKQISEVSMPPAPAAPAEEQFPAPPVTPDSLTELGSATGSPAATNAAAPTPGTRAGRAGELVLPTEEVERDLTEAVSPATTPAKAQAAQGAPASPQTLPTYIYVNNEFVEAPRAPEKAVTAPSPPATRPRVTGVQAPAQAPTTTGPVDWEELAAEGQQRVIRIPADKIRQGDPNYNVVVRHHDWIQLDPGQTGYFYVLGHVIRPGTYAFNGEDITLTQALAAAGGLDQLAWPTRCELHRRIDNNRMEITQWDLGRIMDGQDPDLFLKKDDVVNVGTHAVAPLLATIRNSFRLTYGFGFVYDRNFADIDAFYGQANPADVRRAQRATRGLLN